MTSYEDTANLCYRKTIDSNRVSGPWRIILSNVNYTSYTVTKTGSGASGTWGISISGNAANSSRLGGNSETAFLRYRDVASSSTEFETLWDQIGIREYHGSRPKGVEGGYTYGAVVSLPGPYTRFDVWVNHQSSNNGDGIKYRSGWNDDKKQWQQILDSNNYTSYCATANHTHTLASLGAASSSHNHDGTYLKLSGGTTTGAVTFGGEVYSYYISVGHPIGTYDRNRAEVDIVTAADTATDLWMGVNKNRCWDFSCRNDATGNRLDVYNKDVLQRFYYTQDGLFYAYGGFVKEGSSANYVLLGNGGHKAVSDFATSGHTHSYLPLNGGTITGTINFSGTHRGTALISEGADVNWPYTTILITGYNETVKDYTDLRTAGSNNNTGFLRLTANGSVGINTTSPGEKLEVSGNIKATSFIKSGGTSSQFLKADGSVDSNSYSLSSHTHDSVYAKKDGTNASGTWGINISGSAGQISNTPISNIFRYLGTNVNNTAGLGSLDIYPANTTLNVFGVALQFAHSPTKSPGTSDAWVHQILASHGDHHLYYRDIINDGSWTSWKKIPYTEDLTWSNISSKPETFPATAHDHDGSYLKLSGGTLSGNLTMSGNILLGSNYTYTLGSNTSEFKDAYIRQIGARHIDASAVYSGDRSLYIGFGVDDKRTTERTYFYYSKKEEDNSVSRTLFAEINSNGLKANTRFGVNGQRTDYTFYVNGTSWLNGSVYLSSTNHTPIIIDSSNASYCAIQLRSKSHSRTIGIHDGELFVTDINNWSQEYRILDSNNYTSYINSTNFPGLAGVRSVSINGNTLRVNTNGTNNDLTIQYATNAGNAATVNGYTYGFKEKAIFQGYDSSNVYYYYWYKIPFPGDGEYAIYEFFVFGDINYPSGAHYILYVSNYTNSGKSYYLRCIDKTGSDSQNGMYICHDNNSNVYIQGIGQWSCRMLYRCIKGTDTLVATSIGYGTAGTPNGFTNIGSVYLNTAAVRTNQSGSSPTGLVTHVFPIRVIADSFEGNATSASSVPSLNNTEIDAIMV